MFTCELLVWANSWVWESSSRGLYGKFPICPSSLETVVAKRFSINKTNCCLFIGQNLAYHTDSMEGLKYIHENFNYNVSSTSWAKFTALHKAAYNGQFNKMKYLIDEMGFDLNARAFFGRTPLMIAAQERWFDGVYFLIEKSAQDAMDDYGFTAMDYALITGDHSHVAQILRIHGYKANRKLKTPHFYGLYNLTMWPLYHSFCGG